MNKKALLTALVLGGAIVYCIRRLTQRGNQTTEEPPVNHRAGKHLTDVFSRAKAVASGHNFDYR